MISDGGFTARTISPMPIARLLGDSLFVRLLRGDTRQADLVVSMAGIKLGERVVVIGLADPGLPALLGRKVGITGRACGVDPSPDAVARASRRARQAGVLVETETGGYATLPYEHESFDIAVLRARGDLAQPAAVATALVGARQVLRDGGRCLVIADAPPKGLRGALRRAAAPTLPMVQLLTDHGYRGGRILAERDGLLFAEAVKRT
jgi:SAM-dependent methyltransferase